MGRVAGDVRGWCVMVVRWDVHLSRLRGRCA